ncbi:AB-hydrolase YheT [Ganoderma leucocontextum]|nr:AB-hydrolase YheT [Ganoderma leucocontextum]
MAFNLLLAAGLVCTAYVIRLAWRRKTHYERSFVALHMAQQTGILPREDNRKGPALSLAQFVKDKVPALGPTSKFHGVWWLPGGDAQTAYCSLGDFSKADPIVYERKFLELPDGGVVAVDITPSFTTDAVQDSENVLIVAHGLTGGSHEAYVRAVLAKVTLDRQSGGLGFRAVVLNFRGCNGSPVVTPRLYHAGSSDDIRHVVLWISTTFPGCRMYGLGFSLGANILAKYAGEEGEQCPLQGLVTLANPWNFLEGSHYLPSTFLGRYIYRFTLGGALRALLRLHRRPFLKALELPVSRTVLEDVFQRRNITLRQYDELITAPMYGFASAYDYYSKISSSRLVPELRIPCLSINSIDDPITGVRSLPIDQVPHSPYLVLAVTKTGGHLGWFERTEDGRVGRWYVEPVEQFLAALVEYGLPERQKPGVVRLGADLVRQAGRDEVGYKELSPEEFELVVSGTEESKLFTGW